MLASPQATPKRGLLGTICISKRGGGGGGGWQTSVQVGPMWLTRDFGEMYCTYLRRLTAKYI